MQPIQWHITAHSDAQGIQKLRKSFKSVLFTGVTILLIFQVNHTNRGRRYIVRTLYSNHWAVLDSKTMGNLNKHTLALDDYYYQSPILMSCSLLQIKDCVFTVKEEFTLFWCVTVSKWSWKMLMVSFISASCFFLMWDLTCTNLEELEIEFRSSASWQ